MYTYTYTYTDIDIDIDININVDISSGYYAVVFPHNNGNIEHVGLNNEMVKHDSPGMARFH